MVSSEIYFQLIAFQLAFLLCLSTPHGIEIPGSPAIFTDTVQISAKYISNGLFDVQIQKQLLVMLELIIHHIFQKPSSNSFY